MLRTPTRRISQISLRCSFVSECAPRRSYLSLADSGRAIRMAALSNNLLEDEACEEACSVSTASSSSPDPAHCRICHCGATWSPRSCPSLRQGGEDAVSAWKRGFITRRRAETVRCRRAVYLQPYAKRSPHARRNAHCDARDAVAAQRRRRDRARSARADRVYVVSNSRAKWDTGSAATSSFFSNR